MSPPSLATAGPDAGLEQILDRVDDLDVGGIEEFVVLGAIRAFALGEQGRARGEMLHDRAEHRRLQRLPVGIVELGDGDEVGAVEHAVDALDVEQCAGERRALGAGRIADVERPPSGKTVLPGKNLSVAGFRRGLRYG